MLSLTPVIHPVLLLGRRSVSHIIPVLSPHLHDRCIASRCSQGPPQTASLPIPSRTDLLHTSCIPGTVLAPVIDAPPSSKVHTSGPVRT